MHTRLTLLAFAAFGAASMQAVHATDLVAAAESNDRAAVLAELDRGADAKARCGRRHHGAALGRVSRRRPISSRA